MFISTAGGGISITSTQKLFNVITNYYSFNYKLEYYNISTLYFTNPFFKNEVTYLNAQQFFSNKSFLSSLKSLFFKKKDIKVNSYQIFSIFKSKNYHIASVLDTMYHQKTMFNLSKLNFFTIGVVPIYMPKYTLNLALPILNDGFIPQILLLRSTFLIKKKVTYFKINNLI